MIEPNSSDPVVSIYPNPTNNIITINAPLEELNNLTILNYLGQDVSHLSKIITNRGNSIVLNLEKLSQGVYIIKTKRNTTKIHKL